MVSYTLYPYFTHFGNLKCTSEQRVLLSPGPSFLLVFSFSHLSLFYPLSTFVFFRFSLFFLSCFLFPSFFFLGSGPDRPYIIGQTDFPMFSKADEQTNQLIVALSGRKRQLYTFLVPKMNTAGFCCNQNIPMGCDGQ